jgi:hypothetical protein
MPMPRFFREMQACGEIYLTHLLHINLNPAVEAANLNERAYF